MSYLPSDFEVEVLGPGEPVLAAAPCLELRPVKVFVQPTGAKDNTPSFCFKLTNPNTNVTFLAQISRTMLVDSLRRAGVDL